MVGIIMYVPFFSFRFPYLSFIEKRDDQYVMISGHAIYTLDHGKIIRPEKEKFNEKTRYGFLPEANYSSAWFCSPLTLIL